MAELKISEEKQRKFKNVTNQLNQNNVRYRQVDLIELRSSCLTQFGLVNNKLRAKVWPKLLNIESNDLSNWKDFTSQENLYTDQIDKDVNRTFNGFEEYENAQYSKEELLKFLEMILNGVINHDSSLHYYQGFNDIAERTLGLKCPFAVLKITSNIRYYLKFMRENFLIGAKPTLELIYTLIQQVDKSFEEALSSIFPEFPIISVSWLLTWLAHTLNNLDDMARVFDFCIATHALAPVYLSSAYLLHNREAILAHDEPGMVFMHFNKANENIDVEKICCDAYSLMKTVPPYELVHLSKTKFLDEEPTELEFWTGKKGLPILLSVAVASAFTAFGLNYLKHFIFSIDLR